jgi:hypothetical protein
MMSDEEVEYKTVFTEALYEQNKINTLVFSFAMNGFRSDVSSNIDFGNPIAARVIG